jgi:type VI secretion system ImpM family protein
MDGPNSPAKLVGWHGKLPTVGDFATRRLDPAFVSVWDDWLSQGLAKFRAQDETRWVDAYLASPTWRFFLTPGFLPEPLHRQAWAGIVMPSMDRVGRYYPLTIATPLESLPVDSASQASIWTWLHRIDDAAADALQEDWSIDALEAELARIGAPNQQGRGLDGSVGMNAPVFVADFFSVGNAAMRLGAHGVQGVHMGGCTWRSEAGLLPGREFQSVARDDSILTLWRG